ncbi:hypothetical protein F4778DRAFT_142591 [Xylariomycetidae sp. FL2044]|nr:hypothetical protein F4778DRAFT_142591 [Xylariomycetidae sp. FL2044]
MVMEPNMDKQRPPKRQRICNGEASHDEFGLDENGPKTSSSSSPFLQRETPKYTGVLVATTSDLDSAKNEIYSSLHNIHSRVNSLEDAEQKAIEALKEVDQDLIPQITEHANRLRAIESAHNLTVQSLDDIRSDVASKLEEAQRSLAQMHDGLRQRQSHPKTQKEDNEHTMEALKEFTDQRSAHLAAHEKAADERNAKSTAAPVDSTNATIEERAESLQARESTTSDGPRTTEAGSCPVAPLTLEDLQSPKDQNRVLREHSTRLSSLEEYKQLTVDTVKEIRDEQQDIRNRYDKAYQKIYDDIVVRQVQHGKRLNTLEAESLLKHEGSDRLSSDVELLVKRVINIENQLSNSKVTKSISNPGAAVESDSSDEDSLIFRVFHKMDFRNQVDLARYKDLEDTDLMAQLYAEEEAYDGCYTVQRGLIHRSSYLLCRSRKRRNMISGFWQRKEWQRFPAVLEVELDSTETTGQYYPRYVIEIGEVFNRRIRPNGQNTHMSTGYHLVMDIARPEKSLWIVYRYAEIGERDHLRWGITFQRDDFWHPFSTSGVEFDIAQVFADVRDWKGNGTELNSFSASLELVKRTGRLLKPTFVEPVLADVKEEIADGWANVPVPEVT